MPSLFSINETAQRLSVSPWTLRKWINQGRVNVTRLGRRILISNTEIERLCQHGLEVTVYRTKAA